MPTYGYECKGCGRGFEVVQKISDDNLTTCEVCGGELRKKMFPVGIVFKGTGFYVNDYANKGGKAEETAPAPSDVSDVAKADSGSASPTTESGTDAKTPEQKPAETKAVAEKPSPSPAPVSPT